jgi:hypothetical protein
VVEGGEYNCATGTCNAAWTNLGAIYDPLKNSWTSVNPPAGWTTIGDAQSVVLPNGTYMQADCCTKKEALFNPANLTWTPTGTGKFDIQLDRQCFGPTEQSLPPARIRAGRDIPQSITRAPERGKLAQIFRAHMEWRMRLRHWSRTETYWYFQVPAVFILRRENSSSGTAAP